MKSGPIAFNSFLMILSILLAACSGNDNQDGGQDAAAAERREAIRRLQNPVAVAALGRVIPEEELLELTFETSGRVQRIFVAEGGKVSKDAPLIMLDAALEDNQLRTIGAQLERNRLEQEDAQAQARYYGEVLEVQRKSYRRLQRSVEADALPASELDPVDLDMKASSNQAANAARLLQRLKAEARELRLRQEEVRLRRQQKELKAPGAGTILRWEVRENATANAYEVVGEFAPDGPLLVEAEVDEYFATNVRIGQKAVIRREGYNDTLGVGQVIFTADKMNGKSILSEDNSQFEDRQVRRIKVKLEDGTRLLLGMKVEALIQTLENR